MQQVERALRHVNHLLYRPDEFVVRFQVRNLLRKVIHDGLLDAMIEELGVRRCVEVALVVQGVIEDLDIATGRWLPIY